MKKNIRNSRNKNTNNGMRKRREELKNNGFEKLSTNVFIRDNEVVVLKSVVNTTNKCEIKNISMRKKIYKKIKDKSIVVEVFERNCFRSVHYTNYSFRVFDLIPTHTYRSRKNKTWRYQIIDFNTFCLSVGISVNIIIDLEMVS